VTHDGNKTTVAMRLVENLARAARDHHDRCEDSQCNVSMLDLRCAAEIVASQCPRDSTEFEMCRRIVLEMPL